MDHRSRPWLILDQHSINIIFHQHAIACCTIGVRGWVSIDTLDWYPQLILNQPWINTGLIRNGNLINTLGDTQSTLHWHSINIMADSSCTIGVRGWVSIETLDWYLQLILNQPWINTGLKLNGNLINTLGDTGSTQYWHSINIMADSRYLMETWSTPWVTLDQHSTDTPSTSWSTVGQLLTNFFINSYQSAHTGPNINWLLIKFTRCHLCIDRDVDWKCQLGVSIESVDQHTDAFTEYTWCKPCSTFQYNFSSLRYLAICL